MQLLKDKTAIITGGTAGIGKAIACLFSEHGANVIILGTNSQRAELAVQEIQNLRSNLEQKVASYLVDVSDTKQVDEVMQRVLTEFGKVDVLVNNAGITKDGLLMKMSEEDWDTVLDVNLKSVYNTCKSLVRSMMRAKSGTIINISSVIGLVGNPGQANYAASKSGIIGFTKAIAQELASRSIRVNCLAPGYIETSMTENLPVNVKEAILSKIPLSRIGHPKDIANAALFLASDLSSYMTGQVLTVDGGMVM
jgi:3-oxoacyl-[acyl-carrier protein] reductase